jgi:hypothetical protein
VAIYNNYESKTTRHPSKSSGDVLFLGDLYLTHSQSRIGGVYDVAGLRNMLEVMFIKRRNISQKTENMPKHKVFQKK